MTIERDRFRRVSRKRPCEICGHSDWCTFTENLAFCMRDSHGSFKTARNGAHIHRLNEYRWTTIVRRVPEPIQRCVATEDHRHRVYTSLLLALGLSTRHLKSLLERGFDSRTIHENGYASAPTEDRGNQVSGSLENLGLGDIPGFYKSGDRWRLVKMPPGLLIPVRNERGQSCGIQIRLDNFSGSGRYIWLSSAKKPCGTSSRAPLHWSTPGLLADANEVLLTEGALKGDAISYFLSAPVIAAAGVSLFGRGFGAKLKADHPKITAIICFDSDWRSKPQVKDALIGLQRQLTASGVPWKVRVWPTDYKGYDDCLFAMHSQEVAA